MAEQEHTAGNETFVEHVDDVASSESIEVDDDVAAEDDVAAPDEVRPLGVEQVHLPEVAERAHLRRDAEKAFLAAFCGHEPLLARLRRRRAEGGGTVHSATRRRDAPLREVGAI